MPSEIPLRLFDSCEYLGWLNILLDMLFDLLVIKLSRSEHNVNQHVQALGNPETCKFYPPEHPLMFTWCNPFTNPFVLQSSAPKGTLARVAFQPMGIATCINISRCTSFIFLSTSCNIQVFDLVPGPAPGPAQGQLHIFGK